jgi:hypothetical protein
LHIEGSVLLPALDFRTVPLVASGAEDLDEDLKISKKEKFEEYPALWKKRLNSPLFTHGPDTHRQGSAPD